MFCLPYAGLFKRKFIKLKFLLYQCEIGTIKYILVVAFQEGGMNTSGLVELVRVNYGLLINCQRKIHQTLCQYLFERVFFYLSVQDVIEKSCVA